MKIIKLLAVIFIITFSGFSVISCSSEIQPANHGSDKKFYERLKLGEKPSLWEDGFRTSLDPGNYEWWYFDAHLSDGSILVVAYHIRSYVDIDSKAVPQIELRYTSPEGKLYNIIIKESVDNFSASRDKCDVKIGKSWIKGNLKDYTIHLESDTVNADLLLKGIVPAWRPGTGHIFFGKDEKSYFAWLPSVPYGKVTGVITVNGKTTNVTGSGYHDHNWGNTPLANLLNNWWWTRAQFGDYTIITSEMTATDEYGRVKLPVFMLAYKDKILMEEGDNMTLIRSDAEKHPLSGKPVENVITFNYSDPANGLSATYTLTKKKYILDDDLLRMIPSWKAFIARIFGIRPWYHRILGDATLDIDIHGKKESMKGQTVYELMYLGKPIKQ